MHQTLTAHMIVKNEDQWIYFSVMSIISHVDKLLIFDNGSTDKTVEIIKYLLNDESVSSKIIFAEKPQISPEDFWQLRQEQIALTETDYMMVVDGDEIYWDASMRELRKILDEERPELVTAHFINCGGDIYHYRDNNREHYCIDGVHGAYTNRVFSMHIEGLHCSGKYGIEGYKDKNNQDIQNHGRKNIFMTQPYLHMSLLKRSSDMSSDLAVSSRIEKLFLRGTYDYSFPKDFEYPEVLSLDFPPIVDDPWKRNHNLLRLSAQAVHNLKFLISKNSRKSLKGPECL